VHLDSGLEYLPSWMQIVQTNVLVSATMTSIFVLICFKNNEVCKARWDKISTQKGETD
jgi:hypothetical protein